MGPPFAEPPHVEASLRRVRVLFAGKYIVDTQKAQLVWEHKYFPIYYFHADDVAPAYLRVSESSGKEDNAQTEKYDIVVGEHVAKDGATKYLSGDVAGLVKVEWKAMDAWFEEDERLWSHPKNPYDFLRHGLTSSLTYSLISGLTYYNPHAMSVSNSTASNLPIPTSLACCSKLGSALDLLEHSELTTDCSYKGTANYYNVRLPSGEVTKDIVWWYRIALPECSGIQGFVAFYDEKVDVWVDGVKK